MCMRVRLARRRRGVVLFITMLLVAGTAGFALVGLRRTETADLRRDFTDTLLVTARDHDLGLRRHRERDALRRLEHDRVGETQRQIQVLSRERGTIADADE